MLAKALDRISVRTIHITPDGMFAGDMLRVDRASRSASIHVVTDDFPLLSVQEGRGPLFSM